MTVQEFFDTCQCRSKLRVKSAYNGKILCYEYNPKKHLEIGQRAVTSIWADMQVIDNGFGNYALPYICCFADGTKEWVEDENFRRMAEK